MSRIRNTAHYALQCARYGQYGPAIEWANTLPRNTYRAALIVLIRDTYGAYEQRERYAKFETNVRLRQWFAHERRLCRLLDS